MSSIFNTDFGVGLGQIGNMRSTCRGLVLRCVLLQTEIEESRNVSEDGLMCSISGLQQRVSVNEKPYLRARILYCF